MNFYTLFLLLCFIKFSNCNKCRLPTDVVPVSYDIKIISMLTKGGPTSFVFDGESKIRVRCGRETNRIIMHSLGLDIINIAFLSQKSGGSSIKVLRYNFTPELDFLNIYLKSSLAKNKTYTMNIKFSGNISTALQGYYRSKYGNNNSNKTWLALTQFEPHFARSAFPCFDEPLYKAKFKISLGHHKELHSISNMPKEETISLRKKDFVLDVYKETVPMSTYLVAYIISDFGYVSSPKELSNTEFKIWARKSALSQTGFAAECGPKALTFYERTFDIPFPLPKQDMVAVPDFRAGAMENWGLITYRESALLFDNQTGTLKNKNVIAMIICHELAHMWFGNLVTMKWWNDIWLNEGFATYMSAVCVDNLYPEFDSGIKSVIDNFVTIFEKDARKTSRQISVEIENKRDIDEVTSSHITYKKGALVIRMMVNTLGTDVFNSGIRRYLKKFAYSNAEQDDLWEALTNVSPRRSTGTERLDVKTIMDSWTLQPGYPIVEVTRNYKNGRISFTQRRYTHDSVNEKNCWWIPLSYTTADELDFKNTKPKLWLSCNKNDTTVKIEKPNEWIIFNIQQSGLYRVNYDKRNWNLILNHLKSSSGIEDIHEINRYALVDNIMAFAETNIISYHVAFNFLTYLRLEKAYLPWKAAFIHLDKIARLLEKSKEDSLMKRCMKGILGERYRIGDISKSNKNKLQTLFVRSACSNDIKQCITDARKAFGSHMTNTRTQPLHSEIQPIIYCMGIKSGGKKEWDFLWQKYLNSNVLTEKYVILGALGCTRQEEFLKEFITYVLDERSGIKKQDALKVFITVANNKLGYRIAKSFLFENGKEILELTLPGGGKFAKYIAAIAERITTVSELQELENFISQNPDFEKYAKNGIALALENAELNIKWLNNNYQEVVQTLKKCS